MGNESYTGKRSKEDAETTDGTGYVTTTVVTAGVKNGLNASAKCLVPIFRRVSDTVGLYRHVVSLIAQSYIIHMICNEQMVNFPTTVSWKTFYDQIWSGLDRSKESECKPLAQYARSWINAHNIKYWDSPNNENATLVLPLHVPLEVRDATSREMSINTKLHMDNRFSRQRTYIKKRFVDAQISQLGVAHKTASNGSVISPMIDFIKTGHGVGHIRVKIHGAIGENENYVNQLTEIAVRLCVDERAVYTSFKENIIPTDIPWVANRNEFNMQTLYLILDKRYSDWSFSWRRTNLINANDSADVIVQKKARYTKWNSIGVKFPKPAMLLPHFNLQRIMVRYSATALSKMFHTYIPILLKLASAGRLNNGPFEADRYRDVEFHESINELIEYSHISATKKYANAHDDAKRKSEAIRQLINLKFFKGKYRGQNGEILPGEGNRIWHVADFMTNGIQMNVTFTSGLRRRALNLEKLNEAGFKYPVPTTPHDITALEKGVLRDHEYMHKQARVPQDKIDSTELTCVDPGILKPIHAVTVPLRAALDPQALADYVSANYESATYVVGNDEWEEQCGTHDHQNYETEQKQRYPAFDDYIKGMNTTYRRSAQDGLFTEFVAAELRHASTLIRHIMNPYRSVLKWATMRKAMSALSKVADELANTQKKSIKKYPNKPKRIIVFGDGSFGCNFPRKKVIRLAGVRAPVLVEDEYHTSQKCLCGHALCDDTDAVGAPNNRPRRHTTPEGDWPCFAKRAFDAHGVIFDRDALAAANLARCAAEGLVNRQRPGYLKSGPRNTWRKKYM